MVNQTIEKGYISALNFTKSHYENFPVVSFLIPGELKKHIAVVYQFARQADDIADEGSTSRAERLNQLNAYEHRFLQAFLKPDEDPFWAALINTITTMKLSNQNFLNLLKAFRIDVSKTRYADFDDLLNYCRNSANPVGRIILELHGIWGENIFSYSDSICTALQLTNFVQDISLDYLKGRIYIPLNEIERFGVTQEHFEIKQNNSNFKALIKYQILRNKELFVEGYKLLGHLPSRLKMQIFWTIMGGERILEKIIEIDYNVLNIRPKLNKFDVINLIARTLFKRKNV